MKFIDKLLRVFPSEKTPVEIFLSLEFEEHLIKAAAWELTGDKVEIIGEEKENYEGELIPGAIEAVDKIISRLEEKKQGLTKVIFGLPFEWVEGNKIKEVRQDFLKELCSKLGLSPVGFVVIQEALCYYLQKEEGMPVTAILVQVLPGEIVLTISKIGKIIGLVRKKRDDLLGEVVVSALKDFPLVEILPSRFLLYDGMNDLENVRQELISYPWMQKVDFLHFPKIDILPQNTDIKAIVYAGVAEMAKTKDIKLSGFAEEELKKQSGSGNSSLSIEKERQEVIKTEESPASLSSEVISFQDVGFVRDQDVREMPVNDIIEAEKENETVEMNDFELDRKHFKIKTERDSIIPETAVAEKQPKQKFAFVIPTTFVSLTQKIKMPKLKFTKTGFSFPGNKFPPVFLILIILLIILTIAGAGFIWFGTKANVVLVAAPKELVKETEVQVLPDTSSIDESKKIIPGKNVEVEQSGSKTIATTGIKNVGEKAKGQVTIYNKTSTNKIFSSGTEISIDNLKFTLDSSASVSAQKQDETPSGVNITYGKQTVAVTATVIGAKYNVVSGTKFKVDDFSNSSYEAKNDAAFSGGSSTEVTVVDKSDLADLVASLSAELLEKAKKAFEEKDKSQKLIKEVAKDEILKKNFDKEVGTEGKEVSLDLSEKFSVLSYSDQDIKNVLGKMITPEIPAGYLYSAANTTTDAVVKEVKKDGSVLLQISFKAKLIPKVDLDQIRKSLSGKSFSAGNKFLSQIKNLSRFEVTITPSLPGILHIFPPKIENIKVKIVGE